MEVQIKGLSKYTNGRVFEEYISAALFDRGVLANSNLQAPSWLVVRNVEFCSGEFLNQEMAKLSPACLSLS